MHRIMYNTRGNVKGTYWLTGYEGRLNWCSINASDAKGGPAAELRRGAVEITGKNLGFDNASFAAAAAAATVAVASWALVDSGCCVGGGGCGSGHCGARWGRKAGVEKFRGHTPTCG